MEKAARVLIEMLLENGHSEEDIELMADSGELDDLVDELFEEFLEEAIRHSGGRAYGAFRSWNHGRMSASSPEDLTQRYVDHYGMSTDPFGEGKRFAKTAKRHGKAASLILKHVEKEHGPKSAKALRVAGKHAGRLDSEGYFDGDKQERIEKAVSANSTKKLGDYIPKNAKGKRVFEETEQLDELLKSTLLSYKSKAKKQAASLEKKMDKHERSSSYWADRALSVNAKKFPKKYSEYLKRSDDHDVAAAKTDNKLANRERGIESAKQRLKGTYTAKLKYNLKEDFDTQGLDEETLMEIKMKLKPGQKMTPKQFAQMKADVLAKQKQKAAKKAAPKPAPKEEKVETDDTNRNARILKGQFPWGNVTQSLATAARSSLMKIEKPHHRLKALDKIWQSKDHFNALLGGRLDLKDDDTKKKSGPSLPKVRGVND